MAFPSGRVYGWAATDLAHGAVPAAGAVRDPQRTSRSSSDRHIPRPWDINPWCEENNCFAGEADKHNLSVRRLSDPSLLVLGQWAEQSDDVEHLAVVLIPRNLCWFTSICTVWCAGRTALLAGQRFPTARRRHMLPLESLLQKIRQSWSSTRPLMIFNRRWSSDLAAPGGNHEQSFADAVSTHAVHQPHAQRSRVKCFDHRQQHLAFVFGPAFGTKRRSIHALPGRGA